MMFASLVFSMTSFGSESLREDISDFLKTVVDGTEFRIVEELVDTKRLRAELDKSEHTVELDIDIKDEYVSVKHNIRDDSSSINIKQRFFDDKGDAKECIENLIKETSD